MINNLILFPKSANTEAVDRFVADVLAPALKAAKGLRSLRSSEGPLMGPGGPTPYTRIVEASFDSLDDMVTFGGSQPAKDTAEQMQILGGLILFYEVSEL
jgi:hypothetical protein